MEEKWSERHLRAQKVEALKERMVKEIHEEMQWMLDGFCETFPGNKDLSAARRFMDEMHNLYVLEDFFRDRSSLTKIEGLYGDLDKVFYTVSGDTLEWMMQNEHLLSDILFRVQQTGLYAEEVLNDRFLEFQVFSVMDRVLYEKQKEAGEEKTVDSVIAEASDKSKRPGLDGMVHYKQPEKPDLGMG